MQDIAEWLGRLGMSEYAPRFADNRIDFAVLGDLTDQDLKELGVVLGDRRKLLRAIGELREPEPGQFDQPAKAATAERRQLTVMFCDLVGSTSLSTRLDPEDLRVIIGAYHRRSAEIVQQNGGFVAKYMGDGVIAYFGYPEAVKSVAMTPRIAPGGPILDADDYRRRFPDGRIGSDPSQATVAAGEKIVATAVKAVISEFKQFAAS